METNFTKSVLWFALIFISACQRPVTAEDLAQNVLEAFQNKDVDHALEYILYEDDYEDFFSNSELNDTEKSRLISKHANEKYIEERIKRFKKRFSDILKEGESSGIKWSKTQYEYIEGPNNEPRHGLLADEIYLFFSHNKNLYKLRLDDCYKTSRGWLMSDEPSFEGEVEK